VSLFPERDPKKRKQDVYQPRDFVHIGVDAVPAFLACFRVGNVPRLVRVTAPQKRAAQNQNVTQTVVHRAARGFRCWVLRTKSVSLVRPRVLRNYGQTIGKRLVPPDLGNARS
jgi:hypothetical protein